jgi:hypothetical protein
MHVRVYYRQETINTYNRCGLWDFNEINSVNLAVLGKPHISIFSTRNVICSFGGGGGGFTAVTFLCKYHGKIR